MEMQQFLFCCIILRALQSSNTLNILLRVKGQFWALGFYFHENSENCLYKYRNWNIITIHHEKQLFSAQKQFVLMDFQHKMSSVRCLSAEHVEASL